MTLLGVLINYQVSRRKKLKENKRQKEEEEEDEEERSSTAVNQPVNQPDVDEKRRGLFWQAQRSQPWDREAVALDPWADGHGGQFGYRTDENSQFRCPDCSTKAQRGTGSNPMRWTNRTNGGMETEREREKRRMRMMTEEERRRLEEGMVGRDTHNTHLPRGNSNSSSHPRKEAFAQANRDIGEVNRTEMEGKSRGHEPVHCESCHRTSRPPEQTPRRGRIHTHERDSARLEGVHPQDRVKNVNHKQFDTTRNTELRREQRNATFDLESSRIREQGSSRGEDKREEEARSSRHKDRGKRDKAKVQSSRLVKVKLNLNPLRKGKVHPKRKTELHHSERSGSKKSKDRRTNESGQKTKRSKTKGSTEDAAKEKKEEDRGEEEQDGNMSSTQEKGEQVRPQENQGEAPPPENSHLSDTANTADQSAPALAIGQGHNLQGGSLQYQGAGLVLGSAQLSPQYPVSLSGNHTTNLSQLTGSRLSLQGGNLLLSTMAPGSLFPSGPANPVAPCISGPNMAPSAAPERLSRQPGEGLTSPAPSLLANTDYANPLRASATHSSPLQTSQPAGLASGLAANPAAPMQSLLQSRPPPDSSPLEAGAQGPGLQTGEGVHPNLQTQAPPHVNSLSWPTPPAHGAVTTVENLSNNNRQTETEGVRAGSTVHLSAGGAALTEGPAAGSPGGGVQGAGVSVSGGSAPSMSTPSVTSTGDALLQQEYLSEEEGSSPRRKLRLVLPEKTSSRPPTALERKIL